MTSFCIRHDSLFQLRICSSGFNLLRAFLIVVGISMLYEFTLLQGYYDVIHWLKFFFLVSLHNPEETTIDHSSNHKWWFWISQRKVTWRYLSWLNKHKSCRARVLLGLAELAFHKTKANWSVIQNSLSLPFLCPKYVHYFFTFLLTWSPVHDPGRKKNRTWLRQRTLRVISLFFFSIVHQVAKITSNRASFHCLYWFNKSQHYSLLRLISFNLFSNKLTWTVKKWIPKSP